MMRGAIRDIASDILSSHSWLGSILATLSSGLSKPLAEFVQFSGSVRPVGIVVSHEKNLLSFLEDEISHLHNVCVRL